MADKTLTRPPDIPLVETLERKFSDMSIICEHRTFQVHRYNLCQKSDVFEREIENPKFEESKGVIKHDEYDCDTVGRMVDFIYEGNYCVPEIEQTDRDGRPEQMGEMGESEEEKENTTLGSEELASGVLAASHVRWTLSDILLAHVQVHGIASYYHIPDLAVMAAERFQSVLQKCSWPQSGFVDILHAIYQQIECEDKGLRRATIKASTPSVKEMLQDATFSKALDQNNGLGRFSAGLLAALAEGNEALESERRDTETYLHGRIVELENDVKRHRDDADRYVKQIAEMMERAEADLRTFDEHINRFFVCRHCNARRAARLERKSRHGKYLVRCAVCLTKHT